MAAPTTKTGYRDGGKTSQEGIHRITRGLYTREGVILSGDLAVTATGSPDTNVNIAAGDIVIGDNSPFTTNPSFFYHSWVTATGTVAIPANASGNPRIDAIVAYIDLSVVNSASNDNPGVLKFIDVNGTAAATPVPPTDATIQSAVGASNPWVLLANVAAANGFSSISNGNISDCRPFADTASTADSDQSKAYVATGLVWAATSGLNAANSLGRAYASLTGGGGRALYKPSITHTFAASKDTYVDIPNNAKPTITDDFTYTPVNNGVAAPALATNSIRLSKVITNGSAVTSVVTSGFDSLGNEFMPKPIGTNQISQKAIALNQLSQQLQDQANLGWLSGVGAPNTVTALGNRSYSCVFNGVDLTGALSAGMRLKLTRTALAPTQCTSLNGSTQYYSKTSPNKLTFTDDFVVSAWVKLSAYPTGGSVGTIASRYNGTSGWEFTILDTGLILMRGYNAGAGNISQITSYQKIPLNKWVHVAAQLDMSTFTLSTTTSYTMIDGLDVPATIARIGSNPTTLIQAGNLEVGSKNGGLTPFPGKIAQVAIYNAKVTQATILAALSQTLSGSETSLASAYSFNNSIIDLNTTTPNDLTPNGSAVATSTDSPFGGQSDGTISSTLDYAIITKTAFSTNTTLTVQVPEGCTIPTSGGVSAVSYSTQKVPYLFPAQRGKWTLRCSLAATVSLGTTQSVWYAGNVMIMPVPVGSWLATIDLMHVSDRSSVGDFRILSGTLSTSSSAETDTTMTVKIVTGVYSSTTSSMQAQHRRSTFIDVSTLTNYYGLVKEDQPMSDQNIIGDSFIELENALL